MKIVANQKFWIVLCAGILFNQFPAIAQSYSLKNQSSKVLVEGTSNVHDWELTAENCSGILEVEFDDQELENIEKLHFTVIAESLISGKSGMDKNTYKALKTDQYKKITFKLQEVESLEKSSAETYLVKASGNLTIAGLSKKIATTFQLSGKKGGISLTGKYKLDMTDYEVEPPTALFGTITTGKEVTIDFQLQFN